MENKMGVFVDLTGQVFNNRQALKYLGHSTWLCKCLSCGLETTVRTQQLKNFGCNVCWKCRAEDNYFEKIDTPNKAYIFGFLWADGTIYTNTHKIKLELQKDDLEILEKIKRELKWTGEIKTILNKEGKSYRPKETISYRMALTNKKIVDDLAKKGFKTHRESSPLPYKFVPRKYLLDFIRGYFDGNGCISFKNIEKNVLKNLTISICGGTTIIHNIGTILTENYGLHVVYHRRRKNNPDNDTLYISRKNDCVRFLNLIYENSSLHLQRKYQKFLTINNCLCGTTIESISKKKDFRE